MPTTLEDVVNMTNHSKELITKVNGIDPGILFFTLYTMGWDFFLQNFPLHDLTPISKKDKIVLLVLMDVSNYNHDYHNNVRIPVILVVPDVYWTWKSGLLRTSNSRQTLIPRGDYTQGWIGTPKSEEKNFTTVDRN